MFRVSVLVGFCIVGLALVVGTSASQEKKKKGSLPPGFKDLKLSQTQEAKIREIGVEYAGKIAELNKKITDLRQEETKAQFAVLTDDQKELYFKNKTGEDAKKKDAKKDEKKSDR